MRALEIGESQVAPTKGYPATRSLPEFKRFVLSDEAPPQQYRAQDAHLHRGEEEEVKWKARREVHRSGRSGSSQHPSTAVALASR